MRQVTHSADAALIAVLKLFQRPQNGGSGLEGLGGGGGDGIRG